MLRLKHYHFSNMTGERAMGSKDRHFLHTHSPTPVISSSSSSLYTFPRDPHLLVFAYFANQGGDMLVQVMQVCREWRNLVRGEWRNLCFTSLQTVKLLNLIKLNLFTFNSLATDVTKVWDAEDQRRKSLKLLLRQHRRRHQRWQRHQRRHVRICRKTGCLKISKR